MPKIRLLGGKPLLVGGKVALSDNCCCATTPVNCPLPDGDCPHSVNIEFKLDSSDTADRDILELFGTGPAPTGGFLGFYFDGTDWQLYSFDPGTGGAGASMTAIDPYDTWHSICIQMTTNHPTTGNSVHVEWSMDGIPGDSFDMYWSCSVNATEMDVGAFAGSGDPHRTIRLASLLGNPDNSEADFNFPSDSFDSLNNGAVIDGEGNLRIDAIDDDCWAAHIPDDPGLDMTCACCCARDCTEITGMKITYDFSGAFSVAACPANDFTFSKSHTFDFPRINSSTSFGSDPQIKLFFTGAAPDDCVLNFTSNHFYPVAIRHDFDLESNLCILILDRLFPTINYSTPGNACDGGTIDLDLDETSITAGLVNGSHVCPDPPPDGTPCKCTSDTGCACPAVSCGLIGVSEVQCGGAPGLTVDFTDIPWDPSDMSSMIGTYVTNNSCDDGLGRTMDVTVTLEFY